MKDLAQISDARPITLNDCKISEALWTKLSDAGPAALAVEDIVSDAALLDECRTVAPQLERTIVGAGEDGVRRALQTLVIVFGVGEAAKSPAFWQAYLRQLIDLPESAVLAAVDDYIGKPGSEFFPKPGPLRELALKRAASAYQAVGRLRAALKAPAPRRIDRGTAEQRRAMVEAMLPALMASTALSRAGGEVVV